MNIKELKKINFVIKKHLTTNTDSLQTIKKDSIKYLTDEEFSHWFSGFSDAESNFYISDSENKFTFRFSIKLHIDDLNLLQFIQQRLKIGKISTTERYAN
jgi:hypothetical protein